MNGWRRVLAGARRAGGAALLLACAAACSNHVDEGIRIFPPDTVPISLAGDVQPIFDASCAEAFCHGDPNVGLDLRRGRSWEALVGVPSLSVPELDRVEPGQPDASFLVHKLQGTQTQFGPAGGSQMPFSRAPLPDVEIELVRSWIEQGAEDN